MQNCIGRNFKRSITFVKCTGDNVCLFASTLQWQAQPEVAEALFFDVRSWLPSSRKPLTFGNLRWRHLAADKLPILPAIGPDIGISDTKTEPHIRSNEVLMHTLPRSVQKTALRENS